VGTLRKVDGKVNKQMFQRITTNQELLELLKTLSLLADISRICVWLDKRVTRRATKETLE